MTMAQYFRFLATLGMTELRCPDHSNNLILHTPVSPSWERAGVRVIPHGSLFTPSSVTPRAPFDKLRPNGAVQRCYGRSRLDKFTTHVFGCLVGQ